MASARDALVKLTLALVSILFVLLVVELVPRSIGYDWGHSERRQQDVPIFYRQPRLEVGSVFFRRAGPDSWTGNVISDHFGRLRHPSDDRADPYATMPPVSVSYDALGFRNPIGQQEWSIAVVGDSMTELGHLDEEDLFTTIVSRRLDTGVRNLGVSYTATATHNYYLANYAASPKLRHAVLAFYEGNDLGELQWEHRALDLMEESGLRPQRRIEPQTSILSYLWKRGWNQSPVRPRPFMPPNAYFRGDSGEIELDLFYLPPARLTQKVRSQLDEELTTWAGTSRRLGAQPWLLYIPVKIRVLRGQLRFGADVPARFRHWKPGRLPAEIGEVALAHGIKVVDPTAALRSESAAGHLTYNTIWDTHLNRLGSHVVGEVLADAIQQAGGQ